MSTYTLNANKSALIKPSYPSSNFCANAVEQLYGDGESNKLLVGFDELPSSLWYKKITGATINCFIYSDYYNQLANVAAEALLGSFSESAVTYNNAPSSDVGTYCKSGYIFNDGEVDSGYVSAGPMSGLTAIKNGVSIFKGSTNTSSRIATSRSANLPYLTVHYDDTTVTGLIQYASPPSGYVPKTKANTFSWSVGKSGECYGDITQTAATFRWRTAEGATPTEVSCGTATSCTIAANTFSTDSIQWQVVITTNTSETLTSAWYTLSTVEATSTAVIISPKNTILDGTTETVLEWQHNISTGTAQTAANIQTSTDGTTWTDLATVSTATTYTVAANAFAAGQLYWRVRTYNTDNAAGEWSAAANVIVVAAPSAPVVSATQTPRPVITWQATGQQAYQIKVGSYDTGTQFGTGKSHRLEMYLDDGSYTVQVRVQNQYSLWSEWGTCALTVANTAGNAITLTALASDVVLLSWSATGYDAFVIYRNNLPIAKVSSTSYVDNFSIGSVAYKVRGIYTDSDNYGIASANVTVETDTLIITDVDNPSWLQLKYSENSDSSQTISRERSGKFRHFSGSEFPSVETSEFYDKYFGFDVAFLNDNEIANFDALLGKIVCIKSRRGEMVIGPLLALDKTVGDFYVSYVCSVRQIHWNEVVELG